MIKLPFFFIDYVLKKIKEEPDLFIRFAVFRVEVLVPAKTD